MMKMKSTLALAVAIALSGCATTLSKDKLSMDRPVVLSRHGITSGLVSTNYWVEYWNTSPKTIKYLELTLKPYNAVGDVVQDPIRKKPDAIVQDTGPIESGKHTYAKWQSVWFTQAVSTVRISGMKVIYMDGTEQELTKEQIDKAHCCIVP